METNRAVPIRGHYALALRDEVPLPDGGWTVFRHGPGCFSEDEQRLTCGGADCQVAEVCRLEETSGTDPRFSDGMQDLSNLVAGLTKGVPAAAPPVDSLPVRRVTALVGAPWGEDPQPAEHFLRSFGLLRDAVKALRQVTQARTPNVSIERVWPFYMILDEYHGGGFQLMNIVVIERGFAFAPRPTRDDTARAEGALLAAWVQNPVEIYLDFELDARNAAGSDGDYVEAILKAAAAAEIFLKHVAWMLTWEATELRTSDPAPAAATTATIFTMKPGQLLGAVLAPRLKGNWSTQSENHPCGGWRSSIAIRRNSVMHRGYRPSEEEASNAVAALDALEAHVIDRLAAVADQYPRTALLLAGRAAMERRGAYGKVKATFEGQDLHGLMRAYLRWLGPLLSDDDPD